MKFSKILTIAVVALGATIALSGCIRETFPKTSTITQEQLETGIDVDVNLLKGISRGILAPAYGGWEHTDFGFPSVGVYNDQAAQVVVTNGWMLGNAPAYNRFYMGAWGKGYANNGWMPVHFWYTYYPQIKSCNDVIKMLAGKEESAGSSAIARTYRANLYLDLARIFECLPMDEADIELQRGDVAGYNESYKLVKGLTVPIVTEDTTEDAAKNNPRATREELFKFILNDLSIAEAEFSKDTYRKVSATDPDLAVVYGLYARVYLWLGGFNEENTGELNGELPQGNEAYALAAEYAQKAIATFGGAIMSEKEWTDKITGFNTQASSWMWTLFHSTDTIAGNLHQFAAHMCVEASYGYCQFTCPGVGSKYFNHLGKNDFRRKLIVDPDGSYETFKAYTTMSKEEYEAVAPYTFFKFRPAQGNRTDYATAGAIAIPMMRCEEMYFIEMEAIYHTQGQDAAWQKLVAFMTSRDPKYVCPSMEILDEILFNKAIEFWGEGQMMYDFKRLNKGVTCKYAGTNYDEQRRFNTAGRLPWWTAPIPQQETQINLAIKENNPDPTNVVQPAI
jgi:hypothetical protein